MLLNSSECVKINIQMEYICRVHCKDRGLEKVKGCRTIKFLSGVGSITWLRLDTGEQSVKRFHFCTQRSNKKGQFWF